MQFVIEKELCCGCGACAESCLQKCIVMTKDGEGFLYPEIDVNGCMNCNLCRDVCPGVNRFNKNSEVLPIAYSAYCQDKEVREKSSSGGIFTLLAEDTLSRQGIVYGAAFTEDFYGVKHIAVEQAEDLDRLRGSKYLQSTLGDSFCQIQRNLENGREVLFSGTPCQIEGLKRFLRKDYSQLTCVDFICHGIPSPSAWEKYISYREACAGSLVTKVMFRSKTRGWEGFHVQIDFQNKEQYSVCRFWDPYMNSFLKNLCLRPSCEQCWAKGINRVSDITFADFWGIQKVIPEMDDNRGTSLVFAHSAKGKKFIEEVMKQKTKFQEIEAIEAFKYNPSITKSWKAHDKRKDFFANLGKRPFDRLVFDLLHAESQEYYWIRDNRDMLIGSRLYIYGAGKVARKILEILMACKINIEAVVASELKYQNERFCGYTVQRFSDIQIDVDNDVVVVAVSKSVQQEIIPLLESRGIRKILAPVFDEYN